jgi:hypothetical protein
MSAFAFLSLYLQVSVRKELETATLSETAEKYNEIIKKLETDYPASTSENEMIRLKEKEDLKALQDSLQLGKNNYQMEKIVYNNQTTHYDQLEKFIL